jgi:serine protease Do
MTRRTACRWSAAAIGAVLLTAPQTISAKTVNCFDPARQIVQQVDDYNCRHRIVSDAEARAIRQKRNEYIRKSIETERKPSPAGMGSGFFVSADGNVVTNNHVIAECKTVSILLPDGQSETAHVLSASAKYDLAVLDTDVHPSSFATITRRVPAVGSNVEIVGFPASLRPRRLPLRAGGTYNGTRDNGTGVEILLVGLRVMGGSSGSPVLDDDGRVIGVVFAKVDPRKALPHDGKPLIDPDADITLATKAADLVPFLEASGVHLAHETTVPDLAESYAVRVNCQK